MSGLSRRETDIYAALVDALVIADPPLLPVEQTSAVKIFDQTIAAAPRANRIALRLALHALEIGTFCFGFRHRLRKLKRAERITYIARIESSHIWNLFKPVRAFSYFVYYSDHRVMAQLGYDTDPIAARAKQLREREGRW